jgi:hypothetical protein
MVLAGLGHISLQLSGADGSTFINSKTEYVPMLAAFVDDKEAIKYLDPYCDLLLKIEQDGQFKGKEVFIRVCYPADMKQQWIHPGCGGAARNKISMTTPTQQETACAASELRVEAASGLRVFGVYGNSGKALANRRCALFLWRRECLASCWVSPLTEDVCHGRRSLPHSPDVPSAKKGIKRRHSQPPLGRLCERITAGSPTIGIATLNTTCNTCCNRHVK